MSHVKRIALGSTLAVVAFAWVMQEEEPRRTEEALWAHAGGFTVAMPAAWEASLTEADASPSELYPVLTGFEHRRRVGGFVRPRYLTIRVLDLGVVPMGMGMGAFANLVTRARAPDEPLGRAAHAGAGVYVTTSRSTDREGPTSQAGVFLRGLGAHAFMIEITSHRKDEAILILEAWRIADSIQHDDEALADLAIPLSATSIIVPPGRAIVPDSTGTILIEVPRPGLVADVSSMDACRNVAINLWTITLQDPATQRMAFSRPIEMRVTCPTSSVTLRFDRGEGRMTIRQVDATGIVRLEEQVPASLWLLPSWG